MQDDYFEWDDRKAAANIARHGVSFETARRHFPMIRSRVERADAKTMAKIASPCSAWPMTDCCIVAYTMRDDRIRIISARWS